MKKFILVILVGFVLLHHLHALDPHKSIQQYVRNHWSTDQGLPGNAVFAVAQTKEGYLWAATVGNGLYRLKDNLIENYTVKDGRLLYGTAKGLVIVDPANLKVNTDIPDVIIEHIIVDGTVISRNPPANRFENIEKIAFTFTAPTFISPEKCRFKYQLREQHNHWKQLPPGNDRTVEFSNLPSGKYTFRVTAANSDGLWNPKGTAITFSIHRTLFSSPVFIFIVLLLTAALALLLLYLLKRKRSSKKTTSSRSTLEPEKSDQHHKKLLYIMEIEKIYRDESLSLPSMAQKLSIPTYYLSQLINEKVGKNFYDFINTYRIEEAQKRLADSAEDHVKILQIAYDVGFNSKASFNRVFKKYTGLTPSQYRKMHL